MKKTKTNNVPVESAESKTGEVAILLTLKNPNEPVQIFEASIAMSDRIDTRFAFNDALMSAAWGMIEEQLEYQMRSTLTRV